MIVGFGQGFADACVENGGGASPDGVGAGGCEEFFGALLERGSFFCVEIEESEDLSVFKSFGDKIEVVVEEKLGGDFGMIV